MVFIVISGVLLFVCIYLFFRSTTARLSFLEKEAEIIDYIDVHGNFDKPEVVTGYTPIVRFEVDGKFYQGTGRYESERRNKNSKRTIVLYNPQNPAEFELKELSCGPVTGCLWVVFFLIALGVSVYFYIR